MKTTFLGSLGMVTRCLVVVVFHTRSPLAFSINPVMNNIIFHLWKGREPAQHGRRIFFTRQSGIFSLIKHQHSFPKLNSTSLPFFHSNYTATVPLSVVGFVDSYEVDETHTNYTWYSIDIFIINLWENEKERKREKRNYFGILAKFI